MTMRPPVRHTLRSRGFSLVEMLVTMTIGSLILLVAVNMLGSTGNGYDRGSGGIAAEREGRAALTQISEDLAKAVWQQDSIFDKASGQAWKLGKLGLFCLQPDDAQSDDGRNGDLCAVGYSVKDIQVGGATVRCLMRSFHESNETFTALKGGDTSSLFKPQDKDEPIAFGVIAFEVTPLSRSSTGRWQDWEENDKTGPAAVRVKLIIARRDLIGKMKNPSDWGSNPLLGNSAEPEKNRYLEVYEVVQRFGNNES